MLPTTLELSNLFIYKDKYAISGAMIVGSEIALKHHVDRIPCVFGTGFLSREDEKSSCFPTLVKGIGWEA